MKPLHSPRVLETMRRHLPGIRGSKELARFTNEIIHPAGDCNCRYEPTTTTPLRSSQVSVIASAIARPRCPAKFMRPLSTSTGVSQYRTERFISRGHPSTLVFTRHDDELQWRDSSTVSSCNVWRIWKETIKEGENRFDHWLQRISLQSLGYNRNMTRCTVLLFNVLFRMIDIVPFIRCHYFVWHRTLGDENVWIKQIQKELRRFQLKIEM